MVAHSDDISETTVSFIGSYVVVSTIFNAKFYKLGFSCLFNDPTTGLIILYDDPRQDT